MTDSCIIHEICEVFDVAKEMMWAYLVHLGECMWGDYGPGDGGRCINTRSLRFHEPTWREITDMLVEKKCCNTIVIDIGEGIQYESHPEIVVEGAWSKQKLAAEIARLRGLGFKVYPKLNFSTGHDKWMGIYSRMVSTPQYYTFCKDVIDEVCELFGKPELFHLGMDEECYSIQERSPMCIIRNGELFWHDINYLFSCVEKHGCRPWVWGDSVWHTKESEKSFVENMSHDALISNWYYGDWKHTSGFFVDSMNGYRVLEEHGFDQVPTGANPIYVVEYCRDNFKLTVENCSKIIADGRLKGFMMAPWQYCQERHLPRFVEAIEVMKETYDDYYEK